MLSPLFSHILTVATVPAFTPSYIVETSQEKSTKKYPLMCESTATALIDSNTNLEPWISPIFSWPPERASSICYWPLHHMTPLGSKYQTLIPVSPREWTHGGHQYYCMVVTVSCNLCTGNGSFLSKYTVNWCEYRDMCEWILWQKRKGFIIGVQTWVYDIILESKYYEFFCSKVSQG